MRTKAFVESMTKLGYKVSVGDCATQVLIKTGVVSLSKVAVISEKEQNKVDMAFTGVGASDEAFKLIMKYANTPIDKRKEEKKYYIKVFKHANDSYLHIMAGGAYEKPKLDTLYSEDPLITYRIAFNTEQIEQLKQRKDMAIDWDKVTLEEVD